MIYFTHVQFFKMKYIYSSLNKNYIYADLGDVYNKDFESLRFIRFIIFKTLKYEVFNLKVYIDYIQFFVRKNFF
jgi:hypothetical protein